MKDPRFFKFCLLKAYFDKGYSVTTYFKYLIVLFGVSSENVKWTLIFGLGYLLFCFILGYFWFKYRITEAEIEVNNRYDLFVQEMRKLSGCSVHRKT